MEEVDVDPAEFEEQSFSSFVDVDSEEESFYDYEEPSFFEVPQQAGVVEIVVEDPSPSIHLANGTPSSSDESRQQSSQFPEEMRDSLYRAALRSDWESANVIFQLYQDAATVPISQQKMNALQVAIAVTAKYTTLVKELLKCMTREQLEFTNNNGDTALAIAALSGNVKIAKEMVKKNDRLPMFRNNQNILPLLTAAIHRHKGMMLYLYSVTKFDELNPEERIQLLLLTISCDMYDMAKKILAEDPTLAIAEDRNRSTALEQLARKPFAIGSRSQMSTWDRCIGFWSKKVYWKASMRTIAHELVEVVWSEVRNLPLEQLKKYSSTIFLAAELGNVEFLTILIRSDPELIWMVDGNNRNVFHISIVYRQQSIFNLIHEIGVFKDMIATICDKKGNNMLHLAGKLAPVDRIHIVSGAALQMQHELLWFKEIEKIVPLSFSNAQNLEGQMPKDLFIKTHEKLQRDGEKWMRNTATNCMLVATLIATMVFAAAFTVPGGNDQEKGTPIFLERNWFIVFFISDSIALVSSTSSVLIFLSILTSRYTEDDFLHSLPKRLVLGLTTLFISIVAMVGAFGATCFLVFKRKTAMVPSVTILLACVPIFFFILLHSELFFDIIRSTFWSRFLFRPSKRKLF